jgi:hypothetical protein
MDQHISIFKNSWGLSSNKDPNGDGIITAKEEGYIYKTLGPSSTKSFKPLFYNTLAICKTLVLISCIGLGAMGIYSVFGCKARYLQYTSPFQTQMVLFLVFFINIFIVSSEIPHSSTETLSSNIEGVNTIWLGFLSFACLIIFNIISKLGNTWAFYRVPFYPGPLTWWGIIMFSMIFIFALDNARLYWKNTFKTDVIHTNEKFYYFMEIIMLTIVSSAIFIRFIIETIDNKTLLGDKFNFIKFLFGQSENKIIDPSFGKKEKVNKGHCKLELFKKFDTELKNGYKNSPWTKFLKYTGLES